MFPTTVCLNSWVTWSGIKFLYILCYFNYSTLNLHLFCSEYPTCISLTGPLISYPFRVGAGLESTPESHLWNPGLSLTMLNDIFSMCSGMYRAYHNTTFYHFVFFTHIRLWEVWGCRMYFTCFINSPSNSTHSWHHHKHLGNVG